MKALHSKDPHPVLTPFCEPCVYYSRNLDKNEYPAMADRADACGLGFIAGDSGCREMRTDNCSMKKAE